LFFLTLSPRVHVLSGCGRAAKRESVKSCLVLLTFCSALWAGALHSAEREAGERVRIQTELGDIEVLLDSARAPVTTSNFLKYVEGKFYDGGSFHRTVKPDNQPKNKVKIEVVQAAANPDREKDSFPPIALERTDRTGLKHRDGTLSMARDGPNTATSDFFICIGDQPSLDYGGKRNPDGQGFAAFGRVVQGMEVVKRIQSASAQEQQLMPPVRIFQARRRSAAAAEKQP
jgi:peptidyl-prolyl cis-trans isomerase A (cyclophilin A)